MTQEAKSSEGPGRPGQFACGGLVAPNGLIYVPVQVSPLNAGEPTVPTDGFLDAVVDTGTNSTVVSPSVVDRLGIVTRPGPAVRTFLRAQQDADLCELEVWLTSDTSEETGAAIRVAVPVKASVLPLDDCDLLLGTDPLLRFDFGHCNGRFQIVLQRSSQ